MRNHSYENDFDLHENETACRTHFHMKGFVLRLVLKQRHKGTRKWRISIREFPLSLAQLWHINKVFDKLFLKSSQRESTFTKIMVKTTLQVKYFTWLFVKKTTSFLQRISITTRTIETTTPPSRIIKTPAKLLTSRLCVLPVFFCEGFGHWLRSSHHRRRVFSIKFFSRSYKQQIEARQSSQCVQQGCRVG